MVPDPGSIVDDHHPHQVLTTLVVVQASLCPKTWWNGTELYQSVQQFELFKKVNVFYQSETDMHNSDQKFE